MLYIIFLAAGDSKRFGKNSKIFADLNDEPIFLHSLKTFLKLKEEKKIIVVAKPKDKIKIKNILNQNQISTEIITGGKTRQESVFKGFEWINNKIHKPHIKNHLIIHNAANPLVTLKEIQNCLKTAKKYECSAVGNKIHDTIRYTNRQQTSTLVRKNLYLMQTPQIIRFDIYKKAYEFAKKIGFEGTDDINLVENYLNEMKNKIQIKIIPASRQNFKITTKEDLKLANKILNKNSNYQKIGIGEDSHDFDKKGYLTLGGLILKNYFKLKANSDGDVMIHALCNALSSALGGKSLGSFADKLCLKEKITNSKKFLEPLLINLKKKKEKIQSLSFSLECEIPKIDEISDNLKKSIAKILKISKSKIGITATTGNKTTTLRGVKCSCIILITQN